MKDYKRSSIMGSSGFWVPLVLLMFAGRATKNEYDHEMKKHRRRPQTRITHEWYAHCKQLGVLHADKDYIIVESGVDL